MANNGNDEFSPFMTFEEWKETSQKETSHIPLPPAMPNQPKLEAIPPEVLHSGTVESLLGHSEDLSSRLKVALRRNSILEQRLLELENKTRTSLQMADNARTEMEVYREKDSLWRESIQKMKQKNELMQEDFQDIQKRYAEVFQQKSNLEMELQQFEDEFHRTNLRSPILRNRIKLKLKSLIKKNHLRRANLDRSSQQLATELGKKQMQIENLRSNLQQTIERLQHKDKASREEHITLLQSFDEERQSLQKRVSDLEASLQHSLERARFFETLQSEQVKTENSLIKRVRELKALNEKMADDQKSLQEELQKYRKEAKSLFIEHQDLVQEHKRERLRNTEIIEKNKVLEDQVESLVLLLQKAQMTGLPLE